MLIQMLLKVLTFLRCLGKDLNLVGTASVINFVILPVLFMYFSKKLSEHKIADLLGLHLSRHTFIIHSFLLSGFLGNLEFKKMLIEPKKTFIHV